ncbi:MAG: MobF family relaxase [Pseudomonadota bacterium]|nr:MobF family relaxase [Pseudomonadota bacterium]
MINVTALSFAKGSAQYLTQDNYYLKENKVSAMFYGKGAESLGLTNQEITSQKIEHLLSGKLPNGDQIGNPEKHRPGWDITFSAAKSISIQALVVGDERISQAHDEAVKTALNHYENHLTTRQRSNGRIEKHITGSLVAATFQHQTSRELDSQLHTHAVIMNITQRKDGSFRSVSSESLYRMQRELDFIYKTELEAKINDLGYETQKNDQGFEIKSVPERVIKEFSTRSKQIEAELEKYNLSRKDSTVEHRQIATLNTRKAKPTEQNFKKLRSSWRKKIKQLGWQPAPIPYQVIANRDITNRVIHTIDALTEKDAVISENSIYRHLNSRDEPAISQKQLSATFAVLKRSGVIHSRKLEGFDRNTRLISHQPAFVTQKGIDLEKDMLATAKKMNQAPSPSWLGKISSALERLALNSGYFKGGAITSLKSATKQIDVKIAFAAEKGHIWTEEQRNAAISILHHRGKLCQLQGLAGTAKTSSILATIRDVAKQEGYQVIAVAPSHTASSQLQKDINADKHLTTSGYLAQMASRQLKSSLNNTNTLVIHDEAGLASSEQMKSFLELAERSGHRVVNSGDRYQKSSIGSGSAFGLLIDNQVPTFSLTHLFRQKDKTLKKAVEHSLPNNPKIQEGMNLLQQQGKITEVKDRDQRIQTIAQQYVQLSEQDRQKTLVLDPTSAGVESLNLTIREKLQSQGELSQIELTIQTLKSRDIAKVDLERGSVGSVYRITDVITLNSQALKQSDPLLVKGSQWKVTHLNKETNYLTLQSVNNPGQIKEISNKLLATTHPTVSDLQSKTFSVGDKVKFTASNIEKLILTNESAQVTCIDKETNIMELQKMDGSTVNVDASKPQNLDHNYAQTTFSSQGLTSDNVIYHAQSSSTNLMNQRDFYVALSRATQNIKVITDSKSSLTDLVVNSTGEKPTALEKRDYKSPDTKGITDGKDH